jgi:hypothetical protein
MRSSSRVLAGSPIPPDRDLPSYTRSSPWRKLPILVVVSFALLACGPITSQHSAISAGEQAVGAMHVTRAAAKAMTWSDWPARSGGRGELLPAPASGTKVWVVGIQGDLPKLGHGVTGAVVVLDATSGALIEAQTGDWSWPPYSDAL